MKFLKKFFSNNLKRAGRTIKGILPGISEGIFWEITDNILGKAQKKHMTDS